MFRLNFSVAFITLMLTACGRPTADGGSAGAIAGTKASRWVEGQHYEMLDPPAPVVPSVGKVEVIEFFWYGCGHCYRLEPQLVLWNRSKADYIEFIQVPALGRAVSKAHGRLFYTLQTLGRDDLHAVVFDEIFRRSGSLAEAGDEAATLQLQLDLVRRYGIRDEDFTRAYNSSKVSGRLAKAEEWVKRFKVDAVPTVIVNGKYKMDVVRAGGPERLTELIDILAENEHQISEARRSRPAR